MSAELDERWLTFEVRGTVYALPIAGVLEVVELGTATGVPSLPRDRAAVVNWHGDALPVLAAESLLDESTAVEGAQALDAPQILVIENPNNAAARFGLPVDSVLGLVDRAPLRGRSGRVVTERSSIGGRVVGMIDPRQLVVRAGEMVEGMIA